MRANLEAAIDRLRDLPYVDELRSNEKFADKEVVLLMDNCSIDIQAETVQTLAEDRVKVITFPPHTIHIFQCLDLSLFGNLRKKTNDKLPLESDEHPAGFIERIFHLMKQTLVEGHVRRAFIQLGLQYSIDALCLLLFDDGVLRESPRFASLWESDYPGGKPSYRRRNSPFEWVNRIMRPEWNQEY
jgi:hypothetical protein